MKGAHLEVEHRRLKVEHKRLCAAVVAKEEYYKRLEEENFRLRNASPRDVLAAHDTRERLTRSEEVNDCLVAEMERQAFEFQANFETMEHLMTSSLRDQFAMAAIDLGRQEPGSITRYAYAIADAMLEARKT